MRYLVVLLALAAAVLMPHRAEAAIPLCPPTLERLLCTNFTGVPQAANVTINPGTVGAAQSRQKIGVDMTTQIDLTGSTPNSVAMWASFITIPIAIYRWPDDRTDQIHCWTALPYTGGCNATNPNVALLPDAVCLTTFDPNSGGPSGFSGFIAQVVAAGGQINLSANYGTNWQCNGPGDPAEAGAIAALCQSLAPGNCQYDTIGTEIYNCAHGGHLCDDLHGTCGMNSAGQCNTEGSLAGNGGTYGQQFATWQNAIHTAAPGTLVGVLGAPQIPSLSWDTLVKNSLTVTPDFQEIECYLMSVDKHTDDVYALNNAPTRCDDSTISAGPTSASLTGIALGNYPGLPIYMDQWGLYASNPPPQTQSIVASLYYGIQEMQFQLDPNIVRATYHTGIGSSCTTGQIAGEYGWQNDFGANSYGAADAWSSHKGACSKYTATYAQAMANAYSMQVIVNSIHNGEHMLGTTSGISDVLAYGATNGSGYTATLFNRSVSTTYNVRLAITGKASGTGGTTLLYDKTLYDEAGPTFWPGGTCSVGAQCWASFPPLSGSFGAWTGTIPITLPPYSEMSVLIN